MDIERPRSLEAAVRALRDMPGAQPLAGGTDFMVEVNFGQRAPGAVVALRRVEELRELSATRLGAGVPFRWLEAGPWPAMAQAARTVGSPQIRNAGTVGGNLGTASPAGDALPFLAALDAEVELVSLDGLRRLPWHEFLVGTKRTARRPDEVITAAVLPHDIPRRQAFGKVGTRTTMVIAVVSACVVRHDGGATRVALGSVAPTTLRARQAEEMISVEARPSTATLAEFARLVSAEVRPITDHRATEAYRRHAAGVLARRLLERCLAT